MSTAPLSDAATIERGAVSSRVTPTSTRPLSLSASTAYAASGTSRSIRSPWETGSVTTADELIERLGLVAHPEGGHYAETWRGPDRGDGRATASTIHFLLRAGERSHWHRVDASEVWLHHGGAPLLLSIGDDLSSDVVLGPDVAGGQRPHAVVPAGVWQAAVALGEWSLVSCVVAPAFEFDGFELAAPGWSPPGRGGDDR